MMYEKIYFLEKHYWYTGSVADPGSEIRCFFTPWIQDLDPGCIFSGSQIPDPRVSFLVRFS
jgi:hypothetical protein